MHIFLTGAKHVGKSTIIRAWAANIQPVAGFLTLRTDILTPERYAVYLMDISKNEQPSRENRLFFCGEPTPEMSERFDLLGCAALKHTAGAKLLLMDEIGRHEEQALRFQQAILDALENPLPILGVVQEAESAFLEQIRRHKNVRIIQVTQENRDELRKHSPL